MANPALIARGIAIRAAIAKALLPRLRVGERVPQIAVFRRALRISHPQATKHINRVLAEHGVVVRRVQNGRVVVEMPE